MKRREFITLLAVGAWPVVARAQQPTKVPRVGVLLVSGPEPLGPFREALRDLGYAEGKNIQIEVRSAQSQILAFPNWRRNWFAAKSTSSSRYRPQPSMPRRMPRATSPLS